MLEVFFKELLAPQFTRLTNLCYSFQTIPSYYEVKEMCKLCSTDKGLSIYFCGQNSEPLNFFEISHVPLYCKAEKNCLVGTQSNLLLS